MGSLFARSSAWIFNVLNIYNETAYTKSIENIKKAHSHNFKMGLTFLS